MSNTDSEKNVQDDKTKDVLRIVKSLVIDVLHQTLKYVRDISSAPLLKFELDELREEAEHRIESILSEDQANKYNLKTKTKGNIKMSNTDRWNPALKGGYYYISGTGEINLSCWNDDYIDGKRYNIGNCFATEKEAKEVADTWKRLLNEYHTNKNLNWSSSSKLVKLCTDALKNTGGLSNASETVKLPDWCKQDAWIFDYNEREYAQVKVIFGAIEAVDLTYAGKKELVTKSWKYIIDCCCQAKVCPYCDQEMQQLIGSILENGMRRAMVTACAPSCLPEKPQKRVFMIDEWYTAEALVKYGFTLDNRPCGVLGHLENGEWVMNEQ